MKKLLFIYYSLDKPGGIARVLTNLANELVEYYDVTILILVKNEAIFYPLDSRVKLICIDSYSHWAFTKGCVGIERYFPWIPKKQNIKNYLYDWGAFQILKKWLVRNYQNYYAIIGCQYKLSIGLALNKTIAARTIAWEHTDHHVGGVLYSYLRRKNYLKLNRIVTINSESRDYYGGLNRNVSYIANVVGAPYESLPFSYERKNQICFVGRLDKDKNVEELLQIFKRANLDESWKLLIIGEGEERENLERFVSSHRLTNKVLFCGEQKPKWIAAVLQQSKIFSFTSIHEAFAVVLVEAMFAGNVLVSYDCHYGPSDIINERNGFLIPLHDKKGFINVLQDLTSNPEKLQRLTESSYQESKKWTKDRIIEQWKAIL